MVGKSAPALVTALVIFLSTGCASSGPADSQGMAATSPMPSVERFLEAANGRDFDAMARIFGTHRGPMIDEQGNALSCAFRRMGSWIGLGRSCISFQQIELRMNAIAMVLQHDDYEVRSEDRVPGRAHPTIRVGVDLVQGDVRHQDVPFVVVESSGGRWMVEEVGLERITTGRR